LESQALQHTTPWNQVASTHTPAWKQHSWGKTGNQAKERLVQTSTSPELTSRTLLPLGEVHDPNPPDSGIHNRSYYSCPGRMTANDLIDPVHGFNPTTQKQVLSSIWRPRLMTFNTVLDTVPQGAPDCPKFQQRMIFCSELWMWTGINSILHLRRISSAMFLTIKCSAESMILSAHPIRLFIVLKGATKSTSFLWISMILPDLEGQ
jgi:hypothetical protein